MLENGHDEEATGGQPQEDLDQQFGQAVDQFGPVQGRAIYHERKTFDREDTEEKLVMVLTKGGETLRSVTFKFCVMRLIWDKEDGDGFLAQLLQNAEEGNSAEDMVATIVFVFLQKKPVPEKMRVFAYWDHILAKDGKEVLTKNIVNQTSNTKFTLTMTCDATAKREHFKRLRLEKVQNQAQAPTKAQTQKQAGTSIKAQAKAPTQALAKTQAKARKTRKTMEQLASGSLQVAKSSLGLAQRIVRHFKSSAGQSPSSTTNEEEKVVEEEEEVEQQEEGEAVMEDVVLKEEDVTDEEKEEEEQ